MENYPRLFGSTRRTLYLTTLALLEPCSGRNISDESLLAHQGERELTRYFMQQGVVHRNAVGLLELNERFAAANELKNFLLRYNYLPSESSDVRRSIEPDSLGCLTIFGGTIRTQVLVGIVRAVDGITIGELHKNTKLKDTGLRRAADALVRDRIIECSQGYKKIYRLEAAFALQPFAVSLLERVAYVLSVLNQRS